MSTDGGRAVVIADASISSITLNAFPPVERLPPHSLASNRSNKDRNPKGRMDRFLVVFLRTSSHSIRLSPFGSVQCLSFYYQFKSFCFVLDIAHISRQIMVKEKTPLIGPQLNKLHGGLVPVHKAEQW